MRFQNHESCLLESGRWRVGLVCSQRMSQRLSERLCSRPGSIGRGTVRRRVNVFLQRDDWSFRDACADSLSTSQCSCMWPCLLLLVCVYFGESRYKIQMSKPYMQTALLQLPRVCKTLHLLLQRVEPEAYKVRTENFEGDLNLQISIYTPWSLYCAPIVTISCIVPLCWTAVTVLTSPIPNVTSLFSC